MDMHIYQGHHGHQGKKYLTMMALMAMIELCCTHFSGGS